MLSSKVGSQVVGLIQALLVRLGKLGGVVQGRDGDGELGHGVQIGREVIEQLVDEGRELSLLRKLPREPADLVGGRDFAGEQQPEHSLWEHLGARLALGQLLLAVFDGAAVESDALIGVENRALPHHCLQAAHTADGVLDLDLTDHLGAVSLDLFEQLTLGGDDLLQGGLEIRLGRGIVPSWECRIAGYRSDNDRLG